MVRIISQQNITKKMTILWQLQCHTYCLEYILRRVSTVVLVPYMYMLAQANASCVDTI